MKKLITFENQVYEISNEQAEKIIRVSTEGKQNGIWIDSHYIAFPSIKEITEGGHDYHQPYTDKLLGTIATRSDKPSKELLLKGYRKIKPNATEKDIDEFFKPNTNSYQPKYKTWEEAKAAGITVA